MFGYSNNQWPSDKRFSPAVHISNIVIELKSGKSADLHLYICSLLYDLCESLDDLKRMNGNSETKDMLFTTNGGHLVLISRNIY